MNPSTNPKNTAVSSQSSKSPLLSSDNAAPTVSSLFCHDFDLKKRLITSQSRIHDLPISCNLPNAQPFAQALQRVSEELKRNPSSTICRIVIPSLLLPTAYPPWASSPQHVLCFLHALRALLRRYPSRLSVMVSLPLPLYQRQSGLTRWIELLCDGVIELAPFSQHFDSVSVPVSSSGAATQEEKSQGIIKVHRLSVVHERGGEGPKGTRADDNLAFTLTRKRFHIQPFRLPPIRDYGQDHEQNEQIRPSNIDF